MLRLESYLSPFLFSYLSKYIKNIEAKDLQVSLWGGDAVLYNLEFKLDALDNELGKAPFSFVSCNAQELRIHVPWSKLASESVVVTLNTVECAVKLNCHKTLYKSAIVPKEDTPSQPSYVSSLLKKIKNNLTININNLILKYVEDDIVLSINLQTVSYQTVNEFWRPAFVDMSEENLVLRRLWELKDVTVCLDKRGASGLVEKYEEPLLFRIHFVIREHNVYPTSASRKPLATKINLLIERYELNISENQLPLFIHLLQLCLHLYYGTIKKSFEESVDDDSDQLSTSQKQGWASWAWSYVPPVLSYEIEENEVQSTILAFGIYIKNIVVRFKSSHLTSEKQFHSLQTPKTKSLIEIKAEGFKLEIIAKDLEFFSCISSLCNGSVRFLGGIPLTLNGRPLEKMPNETNVLLATGGRKLSGFAADSLFDFRSPENNNVLFDYALTKEAFFAIKSDPGNVFLSQYLYIASDARSSADIEINFSNYLNDAELTNINEWSNIHEQSWKKFVIGGLSSHVHFNSFTLLCFETLFSWASNHSIKPYPIAPPLPVITPEILQEIQFIPTRSSTFLIKNINISFPALCLCPKSYQKKSFTISNGEKHESLLDSSDKCKVSSISISIPLLESNIHQPMYAKHLAAYLSNYLSPAPNLLKACNTQYCFKISSLKVFLWHTPVLCSDIVILPSALKPIIIAENFLFEYHSLQGKNYWQSRLTMLQNQAKMMLQMFSTNVTLQQIELFLHTADSWLNLISKEIDCCKVLDVSHLIKSFDEVLVSSPSFHLTLNNLVVELNQTFASISFGGALKYFDLYYKLADDVIPIIQCTNSSLPMHCPQNFLSSFTSNFNRLQNCHTFDWNDATHCLSFYLQIPNKLDEKGCMLFSIHQVFCSLDPQIISELSHVPSIPCRHLIPFLILYFETTSENTPMETSLVDKVNARYAVQVKFHGGQFFLLYKSHLCTQDLYDSCPAVHIIQKKIMQSQSSVLNISLPKITFFTCGFKSLQISPKLLINGVIINPFTEFGTLNFSIEDATVYSVQFKSSGEIIANYLLKPCAAACTIVFKQNKGLKINVALHVDLESIYVEMSQDQVALFVPIINSTLKLLSSITKNCNPDISSQKSSYNEAALISPKIEDVSDSKLTSIPHFVKTEDDPKSSGSALLLPSTSQANLPFVLWMQCTLPRFMITFHCGNENKVALFVDDVSMSLDYQTVYTKLMMSLSACNISHLTPDETKNSLDGVMFTSMFSILPSFVQKFAVIQENPASEAELIAKPGKFLDLTFTQALAADYRRNVREEESAYHGDSSVVSTSEDLVTLSNASISEVICVIQAFDLLLKPEPLLNVANVFLPLIKLQLDDLTTNIPANKPLNFPLIFVTLTGARLFLPIEKPKHTSDDVVMFCVGKVEINPNPRNPLSRLVVSTKIFKKASKDGLLSCPGSPLEDKQLEITVCDLSMGTTKFNSIISHIKKPALRSDNPALQWNILGETIVEKPVFHPMIEQVNLKIVYAPSIYHTAKNGNLIMVCGPSLEVNITSSLIVHLTTMQFSLFFDLVNEWLSFQKNIFQSWFTTAVKKQSVLSMQQNINSFKSVKSSRPSDRRIKAGIEQLVGDKLLTGQSIKIYIYNYKEDDILVPLLHFQINEPSFVFHVSRQEQKVVLQFHNAYASAALLGSESAAISADKNFSDPFIETLHGECNKRTGVPSSLCTLTIDHCLSNKANLKLCLGIPVKFTISENTVICFKQVVTAVNSLMKSFKSFSSSTNDQSSFYHKFSVLDFETNQVLCEVKLLQFKHRICVSDINLKLQTKSDCATGSVHASGISMRVCSEEEFETFVYPVTLVAHVNSQLKPQFISYVNIKLNSLCLTVNKNILKGLFNLNDALQKWTAYFFTKTTSDSPKIFETEVIHLVKSDDLRSENYVYILAENVEPLPGQIVFSSQLPISSMTWCYNKPHAIRHVSITPIPFNEILGDGSSILCIIESFDEASNCFQSRKKFFVSETQHTEFTLFDDNMPFHEMIFSTKWRVSVYNTCKCHVSPLSLAASMNIEAVYHSAKVPNAIVSLGVNVFKVKYAISQKPELENVCLNLNNFNATLKVWTLINQCVKAAIDFCIALHFVEYYNLTWIPVLLPVPINIQLLKTTSKFDVACCVSETAEIHLSQRIVFSLLNFAYSFTETFTKKTSVLPLVFENCTCKTLLIGQALTDECIKLPSGAKFFYTWRTNKVEPRIHVSVDGLSDWIWSASFCPYSTKNFLCEVDKSNVIIAQVDNDIVHHTSIIFMGSTRIFNYLDFDLQACLMVDGVATYVSCPAASSSPFDSLFPIKDISTILFKLPKLNLEASEVIFVNDLLTSAELKLIEFVASDGTVTHVQTHCHKHNMVDVIAIMPLFLVRSFLPNSVILNIETRSENKSFSLPMKGLGSQIYLSSLSPFSTHHITIQLNENESPFDATIPIHFSLKKTLSESEFINSEKLTANYPYNSHDYLYKRDDHWSSGQGSIQAKMSLCQQSLLVEILPWCLACNQSNVLFCITSFDKNVSVIRPGETTVLHFFSGMFNICASNSSYSEWMTLDVNPELDHPSRMSKLQMHHLPFNGFRTVQLKTNTSIIELLLESCICHGIRVITIRPKWNFVNISSEFQDLTILSCVEEQLIDFEVLNSVVTIQSNSPNPILCWRTDLEKTSEMISDTASDSGGGDKVGSGSVESMTENTTSSFLCVETPISVFDLNDRLLCIRTSELVSTVSVKEVFTKKIVQFHSPHSDIMKKQLVITRHEYHGQFFLVLSDIVRKKYLFQNSTDKVFYLKEVNDDYSNENVLLLTAKETIAFESYMDAELFPMCKKKCRAVKFQMREATTETWTNIIVFAREYNDEVLLPNALLLQVNVSLRNNQVCVKFFSNCTSTDDLPISSTISNKFSAKEFKVVFFDDISNPLYSVDVLQMVLDDFVIDFCKLNQKWIVKLSVLKFQCDNQLYPCSDFPVFLSTVEEEKNCFSVVFALSETFILEKVEVFPTSLEIKSDDTFLQALSQLLQSYVNILAQPNKILNYDRDNVPLDVINEANIFSNPLTFQSLIVHPMTLFISLRASMALSVSIDRGAVTFSKFISQDIDTTYGELLQEIMRHYFAEAVYGAGWVLGSVDLLGNPATTIRSYIKGISDFIVLPYQGIMNGPTAFLGGFTRGIFSLVRHFSAGTLRSVTNIASGISRNLNYTSYQQHHDVQTSQLLLNIGKNPNASTNNQLTVKSYQSGYVTGVTKVLVGVVAKPVGGAAGLVSRTGESILRKVGLEEHKTVRYKTASHTTSSYQSSLSKYCLKLIPERVISPLQLASIDCQVICSNGIRFSAILVLSSSMLYVFQLVDDILETSVAISDIDLKLEENPNTNVVLINLHSIIASEKSDDYCDKVADYLGVDNSKKLARQSEVLKYQAEVKAGEAADLFVCVFKIMKQSPHKFTW